MAEIATRSQLSKPPGMPIVVIDSLAQDEPHALHKGLADRIGQSKLALTFGLADVVTDS